LRTKHVLIDFEDVYVKPNVWQQLGWSCHWNCVACGAAICRLPAFQSPLTPFSRLHAADSQKIET